MSGVDKRRQALVVGLKFASGERRATLQAMIDDLDAELAAEAAPAPFPVQDRSLAAVGAPE